MAEPIPRFPPHTPDSFFWFTADCSSFVSVHAVASPTWRHLLTRGEGARGREEGGQEREEADERAAGGAGVEDEAEGGEGKEETRGKKEGREREEERGERKEGEGKRRGGGRGER